MGKNRPVDFTASLQAAVDQLTGTGTAKLFQQGKAYDVNWSKPDANSRTTFTYADGTPVVFLPGNTWIEVLPVDRTLTVS